ncbi:MAG TPA: hypothetical protein VKA03_01880 [Methylovirgula sp.]|nr:hypothetical protein [Methylovirgula sp.]
MNDEPDTLLRIEDDLDEAKQLVTAAYMAAGDVPLEESGPLRMLLMIVEERLEALSDRLSVMRGAPVEHVEAGDAV